MNTTLISGALSARMYIDPAATTVLISSISAIVVALSTTFIIIWRKAKKKVSKALHIDEKTNKEVEEDIQVIEETEENDK